MDGRVLVKMVAVGEYIGFCTVSRGRKSPHMFYVLRSELAHENLTRLDDKGRMCMVVVRSLRSYAAVWLTCDAQVGIRFTWLEAVNSGGKVGLVGYEETVVLDYGPFSSLVDGFRSSWVVLAHEQVSQPELDFSAPGAWEALRRVYLEKRGVKLW